MKQQQADSSVPIVARYGLEERPQVQQRDIWVDVVNKGLQQLIAQCHVRKLKDIFGRKILDILKRQIWKVFDIGGQNGRAYGARKWRVEEFVGRRNEVVQWFHPMDDGMGIFDDC